MLFVLLSQCWRKVPRCSPEQPPGPSYNNCHYPQKRNPFHSLCPFFSIILRPLSRSFVLKSGLSSSSIVCLSISSQFSRYSYLGCWLCSLLTCNPPIPLKRISSASPLPDRNPRPDQLRPNSQHKRILDGDTNQGSWKSFCLFL
jgi:hypothetical protein